jgi:hypothetical protein
MDRFIQGFLLGLIFARNPSTAGCGCLVFIGVASLLLLPSCWKAIRDPARAGPAAARYQYESLEKAKAH